MDPVIPLEWGRILFGEQQPLFLLEIIAKIGIVYLIALIVLRTGGKRARKQMTPMEMLLVVALGSAVGDVLFYPSVAIVYAVIILLTIVVLQWLTARLKIRFPKIEAFINSKPKQLIRDGKILQDAINSENITTDELMSKLREQGISNIGQVEYAFLELSGSISVFKFSPENYRDGINIIPEDQDNTFLRT